MLLAVILCGLILGISGIVLWILKFKRTMHSESVIYGISMVLCIIIMIVSWCMNMGWYRFILIFFAVPVIHAVGFAIVNGIVLSKLPYSGKLKVYTILSYVTYLLTYICFPDGGDIPTKYVFFGLIKNDIVAEVFGVISLISLVAHIVFVVLQIIEFRRIVPPAFDRDE